MTQLRKGGIANPRLDKLQALAEVMGFPPQLWFEENFLILSTRSMSHRRGKLQRFPIDSKAFSAPLPTNTRASSTATLTLPD